MLQVDQLQTINDLHYRQHWGIRRIARELGINRRTVQSVLRGESDGCNTLEEPRKQRLTAVRLHELLRRAQEYALPHVKCNRGGVLTSHRSTAW